MISFFRSLFAGSASPRKALLGLDAFEDRLVPAALPTLVDGVLFIQTDPVFDDTIKIVAAGANDDGSTGVAVTSSLFGGGTMVYASPVTAIVLDMQGGNDSVTVGSLLATSVYVGEGNGNNTIKVGDTKSTLIVAGSGQNDVSIGGGTNGSAAYLGYAYAVSPLNIAVGPAVGGVAANSVDLTGAAGTTTSVYIVGDGNNHVLGSTGDSVIVIDGDGSNTVKTDTGTDSVTIDGNGDNLVVARGSGRVTVNGSGSNTVRGGRDPGMTVSLNGAGAGSLAVAPSVILDGTAVATSGTYGNVKVRLT